MIGRNSLSALPSFRLMRRHYPESAASSSRMGLQPADCGAEPILSPCGDHDRIKPVTKPGSWRAKTNGAQELARSMKRQFLDAMLRLLLYHVSQHLLERQKLE
jgi:hypothetical protein